MVWAVLHCRRCEERRGSPYERFVGMRLSDVRSGWLFPIHEGGASEERRAVIHITRFS